MAIGFILISTVSAKENEVYSALLKVSEITELHLLFGDYDLIAKVEAKDFDSLGKIVAEEIRSIDGVADTETLIATSFRNFKMEDQRG